MATIKLYRRCFNVRFCPNKSKLLAVISCEQQDLRFTGSLHILQKTRNRLIEKKRFNYHSTLFDIQWCEQEVILTCSGDGSLQLLDFKNPNCELSLLEGHTDQVNSIDFCRRTNAVISASSDYSVILWDLEEKTRINQYQIPNAVIFQAQFRPYTFDTFASVSSDRSLKLWDIRSRTPNPFVCVPDAHGVNCYSCSWYPQSDFKIATSGADSFINVWDMRNLQTPMFKLGPIPAPTKKVAFAACPDNLVGAVSCDGTTRLWNLNGTSPVIEMRNHIGLASGLDWNHMNCYPNKIQMSDCGWDGVVNVYYYVPSVE